MPRISNHDVIHLNFTLNIYYKATFRKLIGNYNKTHYTSINNSLKLYYE